MSRTCLIIHTAVDCGPPKAPQNGRVDYQITTYQSKAYYHCDACATLVGVQRISCKKSGLWSKTLPKCVFDKGTTHALTINTF